MSTEGFVALMTSKESTRALKLVVTPDDPMSGGLDVEQAETSEARTLLQLMQVWCGNVMPSVFFLFLSPVHVTFVYFVGLSSLLGWPRTIFLSCFCWC